MKLEMPTAFGRLWPGALVAGALLATLLWAPPAVASGAAAASSATGGAWTAVPAATPPGLSASSLSLGNMTCVSHTNCVVAGFLNRNSTYRPVIYHWSGTAWNLAAVSVRGSVAFEGSACATPSDCWVVGARVAGGAPVSVIEHGDGGRWSTAAGPVPSAGVVLNGVACTSASSCFAVGDRQTSTRAQVAVARWDGRSWSFMAAPSPRGSAWSELYAVRCVSARDCVALGGADNSSTAPAHFFGARWNGRAWALVAAGTLGKIELGNATGFWGIDCPSARACLAVGTALAYQHGVGGADFPSGVAERWSGSRWTAVKSPISNTSVLGGPASRAAYLLEGVGCPSARDCWVALAVAGPIPPNAIHVSLAHWNGSGFSVVTLSRYGSLNAIGCLPGGWCVALGEGSTAVAGVHVHLTAIGVETR